MALLELGQRVTFAMPIGRVNTGTVERIDGEDVYLKVKTRAGVVDIHRYRGECRAQDQHATNRSGTLPLVDGRG